MPVDGIIWNSTSQNLWEDVVSSALDAALGDKTLLTTIGATNRSCAQALLYLGKGEGSRISKHGKTSVCLSLACGGTLHLNGHSVAISHHGVIQLRPLAVEGLHQSHKGQIFIC